LSVLTLLLKNQLDTFKRLGNIHQRYAHTHTRAHNPRDKSNCYHGRPKRYERCQRRTGRDKSYTSIKIFIHSHVTRSVM